MTPWEYALVALALGVATCVQASLGFGMGLLAAPLLALVDQRLVPIPLLLVVLPVTTLLIVRERRAIELGGLGWALLGRVPGSLLGAAAVAWLPGRGLDATFGSLILLAVVSSVGGWAPSPTRGALLTAGTLSGLMGTAVSTGAAPVALVYQRRSGPGVRGALSGFFFVGTVLSLLILAMAGQIGRADLGLAAVLLPPVAAGLLVSRWAVSFLDAGRTRTAVLVVSGLAALALIGRAALAV